jgi:hypothetical protein
MINVHGTYFFFFWIKIGDWFGLEDFVYFMVIVLVQLAVVRICFFD